MKGLEASAAGKLNGYTMSGALGYANTTGLVK